MTHDELLAKLAPQQKTASEWLAGFQALRAVVELHKPNVFSIGRPLCIACAGFNSTTYPCPTIQAIEKELG